LLGSILLLLLLLLLSTMSVDFFYKKTLLLVVIVEAMPMNRKGKRPRGETRSTANPKKIK
jgi:hypothetical protein